MIVDIGANVGDTVASMVRHTDADFLCIEPEKEFFRLLQTNVEKIQREYGDRVICVNSFVGISDDDNHQIEVEGGTAHITSNEYGYGVPTNRLITLLQKYKIKVEDISLIKVDTDGYDPECIMSLGDILRDIRPIMFWETYITNDNQYHSYVRMLKYIKDCGFSTYFVFDNYGNYLLKTDEKGLLEIYQYSMRILKGDSARTFYYTDILAVKGEDKRATSGINEYILNYPI